MNLFTYVAIGRNGASQDAVIVVCQSIRFEAWLEGQQFSGDEGKVFPRLYNGHHLNGFWETLNSLCSASDCG